MKDKNKKLDKAIESAKKLELKISRLMKESSSSVNEFYEHIHSLQEKILNNPSWIEFQASLKKFSKFFKSIKLSDNEKENIKNIAKEWAKYGFCLPLNMTRHDLRNPPKNEKESNKLFSKIFNKENIEYLKQNLYEINKLTKEESKEILDLFENKMYKLCAMLVFAYLERLVISIQPIPKDNKLRKTSAHASDVPSELEESQIENLYILYCETTALLEEHFTRAEDFKNEDLFTQLNRNFVMHGMTQRNIDEMDCIKLMQLLACTDYVFYAFHNVEESKDTASTK